MILLIHSMPCNTLPPVQGAALALHPLAHATRSRRSWGESEGNPGFCRQHSQGWTAPPGHHRLRPGRNQRLGRLFRPAPRGQSRVNFTRDVGRWQDRKWESIPARLAEGRVAVGLPEGTRVYYVNLVDERDCVVSTEHVECGMPLAHDGASAERKMICPECIRSAEKCQKDV